MIILYFDAVDDFLEAVGAVLKLADLLVGERNQNLAMRALAADYRQNRQTYVVDSIFAVHHSRYGHCRVDTAEQTFDDMTYRNRDCVEGRALSLNDARARLADIGFDVVVVQLGVDSLGVDDEVLAFSERNVRDVCDRPRNERRVAVLAHDIGVYVLLINLVVLGQSRTQTGGVENCARTDDAALGQSRMLAEDVGEYVDRIRDDYVVCIGSVFNDLRNDALHDVDVSLCEVETRLTRLARDTRRDDDDVRALSVAVGAGIDRTRTAKRCALADVERFAESLFVVDVNHDDFGNETCYGKRVGDGGTDASGSDDCNFVHVQIFLYLIKFGFAFLGYAALTSMLIL